MRIEEKLCETESVSTGVLQHGQRYIYEFLWKTSLSSIGETNMHLTNTFKDELTSSLKQYSLMNSLQIAFFFFAFYTFHVVVHHNFFHNRYFNKQ